MASDWPAALTSAELVALAPDVIVGQTTRIIRALRQATSSIPIIMAAVLNQPCRSSHQHQGTESWRKKSQEEIEDILKARAQ
jgi:ABC-type uncharacterized transport system substrate-binding protein